MFTQVYNNDKMGSSYSQNVDAYANAVGMDDRNRTAMKVMVNGTKEEFIKHVFTGDQGENLSYAEMRSRYG
jgi:hypothetical protein